MGGTVGGTVGGMADGTVGGTVGVPVHNWQVPESVGRVSGLRR